MDNLVKELLKLLADVLACQQRLLAMALARREAMRAFDVERLEMLTEQQRLETQNLVALDRRRKEIVSRFKPLLKGAEATVTEISQRIGEPQKTQVLALAGAIKTTVEQLDRNNRINATVSDTVVKGLAKVLKVVTGLAQHAGLYMRNGRKAALHGIHLLEITA